MRRLSWSWPLLVSGAVLVTSAASVDSQTGDPNAQSNPYRLVINWAQLPGEMKWGQVIAFDFDRDGNVFVFHRNDPGILKFSPAGKLLASWGAGMFVQAHSLTVDRAGDIWVTDSGAQDGKGAQVFKFDRTGKLLMTLGKAGVSAEGPDTFLAPTAVVVAASGDVFIADGHGAARPGQNHRILKFSKDGRFIKAWGGTGAGQGQLNDPHALALDAQGRLFVADRTNRRVQVFDQDGRFIAAWPQFGHPENVYIRNDVLYVSDSNSRPETPYRRGIRVGSVRDGSVQYFIPEESYRPDQMATSGPVGLGVDTSGVIYAADVGAVVGFDRMVKKYVRP